jgi:hypothetical protein
VSTIQHQQARRTARLSIAAVCAVSVLSACLPAKEESDGGDGERDASTQDSGVRSDDGRDSGARNDAATSKPDAGRDAAGDSNVATDGDVEEDAQTDASPVIIDPTEPGEDAPELKSTDVGYFNDPDWGARVLIRGRDPNGDIASYTLKFFNGTTPVSYDLDNDEETPSVNEFTDSIVPTPNEAGFFVSFEPTAEFTAAVDTIKVIVTDEGGRSSAEQTAARKLTPRVTGVCDPLGFNRCSGTNVCTRQGSNNVCSSLTSARTNACNAALLLNPPSVTSVRGHVKQPSLWDTPMSCSSGDPTLKPEAVVKLRLSTAASKVVLSTDNEATTFDTTLYLLQSCLAQPAACVDSNCPCMDDVPGSGGNRAVLELSNLPAGDHLIVVDSFPSTSNAGESFELTVSVE